MIKTNWARPDALGNRLFDLESIRAGVREIWDLGRSNVVAWRPVRGGIEVLAAPHFVFLQHAELHPRILHGSRLMGEGAFAAVSRLLAVEPVLLPIHPDFCGDEPGALQSIEDVVRRYAISQTRERAVVLFDIVGFSLLDHVQQMAQLNSLEVSLNVAHQLMQATGMSIDLARSTTGDGCYAWNRAKGPREDLKLCFLLMLVLAACAINREMGGANFVPTLRTCFTVGGHISYYQVDGLGRGGGDYIVGDVTIELARLAAETLEGQILIGDFERTLDENGGRLDALTFMAKVQEMLDTLHGVELGSSVIRSIRCYLTGTEGEDGKFLVNRYHVVDKHDRRHAAFNAKMNIYLRDGPPIFLGVQTRDLGNFSAVDSYHVVDAPAAPWDCAKTSPPPRA